MAKRNYEQRAVAVKGGTMIDDAEEEINELFKQGYVMYGLFRVSEDAMLVVVEKGKPGPQEDGDEWKAKYDDDDLDDE